jgi:predicted nucleic acid-binding protein
VLAGGLQGVGRVELSASNWIETISLHDPGRADLLADLDRGEAEVIALAQELNADLVIIDERLARRYAKRAGLTLTGTLGLLLKAKERNLIPEIAPLIDQLRQGGIRLGDSLVEEILKLADEL